MFDDPAREQPGSGVYLLRDGVLSRVTSDLRGPNGIALSPDERTRYVGNWDPGRKVIMAYDIRPDGTLQNGRVFFDITRSEPGDDCWDGVKVDRDGNVYAAGPSGIYVLSPAGRHLGTITPPEHVANMAWGDADYRTLYIMASTGLYRIRLGVTGCVPPREPPREARVLMDTEEPPMLTASPDTLLDHPALAGHTVYVHRGAEWERWVVRRDGGLEPRPAARPQALNWRTPERR